MPSFPVFILISSSLVFTWCNLFLLQDTLLVLTVRKSKDLSKSYEIYILDLAGKTNQEAALADMIVDGVGDVRTAWYQAQARSVSFLDLFRFPKFPRMKPKKQFLKKKLYPNGLRFLKKLLRTTRLGSLLVPI
jgi:hypothetical protein